MPSAFSVQSPSVYTLRALNYTPLLERFRSPKAGRRSTRLVEGVSNLGGAYGSIFSRIDCEPSLGAEMLSQSDMFSAEPTGRFIRRDVMSKPDAHRVKRWQILIAGAGTLGETELFGRSIIADARLTGKYVSEHALTMTFEDQGGVQNLFSYAFLCTNVGVSLIRSTSYGTKIMDLRLESIRNIYIPDPDQSVKERIAGLVHTAVENRDTYLNEIRLARRTIDAQPGVQDALAQCIDRRARCTLANGPFVTIAARNHASLGSVKESLKRRWNTRLGHLLEENGIYNGPRFGRTTCQKPYGIDFLDQRDVFAIRPVSRRIVEPRINKRLLYVPSHALIVASHGQLSEGSLFGHVETAAFGLHRCGITQDILRVIPKPEHHDFLLAFLSSRLGFLLLKSTAIGTSIPMMHTGLLAELPYPSLSNSDGAEISKHVQAAIKARVDSEAAENEAVRIIEQEVFPSWLA